MLLEEVDNFDVAVLSETNLVAVPSEDDGTIKLW